MYLKKLHIKNFRCFSDYEIEFAPRVTVLFGKNGSGKTTLIHAMHKAMSFIFDKTIIKENKYNLGASFGLKVETYTKKDFPIDFKTGFRAPYLTIDVLGKFGGGDLPIWEIYANNSNVKSNKPIPSKYKEAYIELMRRIEAGSKLPFIAYYSDSFPHIPKMKPLGKSDWALRDLGYLDWNEESACSEVWISRLQMTWKQWDLARRDVDWEEGALYNLEHMLAKKIITQQEYEEDRELHTNGLATAKVEQAKHEPELDAIRKCLIEFTRGDQRCEITNFFNSVYEEEGMCFKTTQGDNPSIHDLPAGYKRMLFMVLDIAYRSYILNKNTDAEGLVIIDEIDLHLHPELEQSVLERFMRTFPKAQFIVSTHSPAVLTGIETKNEGNIVLKMSAMESAPEVWGNVHGIDYNLMLEEGMGVTKRKPVIQTLFDKAWTFIGEKKVEAAKSVLLELEQKTPADQTELVRLRALINRIELIGR